MQQKELQSSLPNVTVNSASDKTRKNPSVQRIGIVIPFFNEATNIPTLGYRLKGVKKLLSEYPRVHLIFVDDGSYDNTGTILEKEFASIEDVHIIRHPKNMGYSRALRTGIDKALELDSDLIVTIDADTNYDHFYIPLFINIFPDDCDLMTASPWHPDGQSKFFPKHRLILSTLLSWCYRKVLQRYNQPLYTYSACFRVARPHVYRKIQWQESDFMANSEIAARCIINGMKIKEVPFHLNPRWFGMSKMKKLRQIVLHLKFLYRIWTKPESLLVKDECSHEVAPRQLLQTERLS